VKSASAPVSLSSRSPAAFDMVSFFIIDNGATMTWLNESLEEAIGLQIRLFQLR
jgi:hypothetical protein